MDEDYLNQIEDVIPVAGWQVFFPVFLAVAIILFLQRELPGRVLDIYNTVGNSWFLALLVVLIPISALVKKLFSQPFCTTLKQFLGAMTISVYITSGFLGQIESFNLIQHAKLFSLDTISIVISFIISLSIIYQAYKLFWAFTTKPQLNDILENKLTENLFSLNQVLLISGISLILPFIGMWLKFSAISNLSFSIFSIINLQNLYFKNYDRTRKKLRPL